MRENPVRKSKTIALFFFIFLTQFNSFSLGSNHPELRWRVIETPHFLIHYHQEEEVFTQQVARVAEEIFPGITSDLGYQPREKTPIVVENYSDNTGAYASILPAKIVIRAQWYPGGSSGNLSWVRQVIAHEFTHIVTFAAIEESLFPLRRLLASIILPMWFIEGLAQYEGEEWHSLKEMVVGDEARENKIMSEASLGAFYFFEGWGRTSGYYQSDSFIRYIFGHYGKDKIAKILAHLRRQPLFQFTGELALASRELALYPTSYFLSFNRALEEILGKDSSLLYSEWQAWVKERFKEKENSGKDFLKRGELLTSEGWRNQHPVFSPSGEKIAFVSNRGYDYAIFDLYLMDLKSKKVEKLDEGVNPFVSFSPDEKKILYAKTRFCSSTHSFLSDLYLIDIEKKKKARLTYRQRADQASFSTDGERIVFVKYQGGNSNLYLLDLSTGQISPLTYNNDGLIQNFSPSFSPDGEEIVFVSFREGRRDIYSLKLEERTLKPLTFDKADDRCPIFSPTGEKIYFVSDGENGVFNLCSLDLEREELRQHTDVEGGVFEPTISPDGKRVVLAAYKEGRFSLYLFPLEALEEGEHTFTREELVLINRGKKEEVPYPSSPYQPQPKLHYLLPWFSISSWGASFSLEGFASDVLERHNLYFSTLIDPEVQYDISYINQSFSPTFWINLYQIHGYDFSEGEFYKIETKGYTLGLDYQIDDRQGLEVSYLNQWADTSFVSFADNPRDSGESVLFPGHLRKLESGHSPLFLRKTDEQVFPGNVCLVNTPLNSSFKTWEGNIRSLSTIWRFADLVPVCDPDLNLRGARINMGVEYSGKELGSDLEYTAFGVEGRSYARFSNSNGLALRILGKRIENRLSFPRVLFSLGGISDLRGYARDSEIGENCLFASLEYRFLWLRRIGGSPFLYFDRLGGVLFFDIGDAWEGNFEDIEEIELKRDIGAELRLRILPFGKYSLVLRLGLAWPLDGDERGANLFLAMGDIF